MVKKVINKYKRFGAVNVLGVMKSAVVYHVVKDLLKQKSIIRKIDNYKLKLKFSDLGISRQLVINGTREEQLKYILQKEIKKGMTILDIGANIGYYPLMEANLVGENGLIYAIEPAPENYQQLLENIQLNNKSPNFVTYNMGVSNRKGVEKFFLSTHSNLHTFMKEGFDGKYVTEGVSDDYIDIEVTDVSSFLKTHNSVDLIRMDVEGYEVEILEGLEKALKQEIFGGKIVFECHFPKYDDYEHSMRKQLEMLFKYNYQVKYMTSNNEKTSLIKKFGYQAEKILLTADDLYQGVYRNISNEHAIKLVCELGGIRDVMLTK